MSTDNRVARMRGSRGWSQQQLASRAGLSRAEVSAIENRRLVPSVTAALGLALAFECAVEDLFSRPAAPAGEVRWLAPAALDAGFWRAQVEQATVHYPAEATPIGMLAYDGFARDGGVEVTGELRPTETIVVSGCDPAVGLLAYELARNGGLRLLPLARGSRQGLSLLEDGLVHAAGLHLTDPQGNPANDAAVRRLGAGYRLLHLAQWQEGLALSPGLELDGPEAAARAPITWAVREAGSGARSCMDRLLADAVLPPGRSLPVTDHRSTAQLVRTGAAQAGICVRVAAEEAGLPFLRMQVESYDLCFKTSFESDPRFKALLRAVRSPRFRRLLGQVPGYDTGHTGEVRTP